MAKGSREWTQLYLATQPMSSFLGYPSALKPSARGSKRAS